MTAREGNIGYCQPEKTNLHRGKLRAVNNYLIILNIWKLYKYIVYITFCFKTISVKWLFEFVFRYLLIQTIIRRQSESLVNRLRLNYTEPIFFLEYHPSSINIIRCQVPSRVRAWFRDLAGDIDFYQMTLGQSESIVLYESVI